MQQVAGTALLKGTTKISQSSLFDADSGIENLKDATLRQLLKLEPLAVPKPLPPSIDTTSDKAKQIATTRAESHGALQSLDMAMDANDDAKVADMALIVHANSGVAANVASAASDALAAALADGDEGESELIFELQSTATIHNLVVSEDEADKTESETDLDDDEQEDDSVDKDEADDRAVGLYMDEDGEEEEEEEEEDDEDDAHQYAADDFRNRSHYCNGKCRLQNKYRSDEFMLRCEACDEWFHGKCLGVKEGVIDDEQVWVCSESCFEQLPLRQRKRDVVVGRPKQKYKKRETKEKTLHDDASKKKRSSYNTKAKQQLQLTGKMDRREEGEEEEEEEGEMEEEMEEPEPVEFSDEYMPRYQGVCSQAPKDVDASLLGQTIMYQLTSPSGWFPAKCKKLVSTGKGKTNSKKSTFLLTYTHKTTQGLVQGERETVLDMAEYGTQGKAKWVLLAERQPSAAEPDKEYCKKSCKHGRDNGDGHWMIFCEGCAVWFHGSCVGVGKGDIEQDAVWVCCQKCKYDLPRNLRSEALVGNSFKKVHEAGTACAKVIKPTMSKTGGAYGDDDSDDDDVPILERAAHVASRASHVAPAAEAGATTAHAKIAPKALAKAGLMAKARADQSDEDEATPPQHTASVAVMKILEPLATFVGASRMLKKTALSAVLLHIRNNALFDPEDQEYVLADTKLRTLIGGRTRVKLRKLAKRVGRYIIDDDGQDDGGKDDGKLERHLSSSHVAPTLIPYSAAADTNSHTPPPPSAGQPPPPSQGPTPQNDWMMVQTPWVVEGARLEDAAPETPSPHAGQHKLTKRLGFSSEVLSPTLTHEAAEAKPSDSAAHASEEVAGAAGQATGRRAENDALEGDKSSSHKKRRLVLPSDSDPPASLPCAANPCTSITLEASVVVSAQASGGASAEVSQVVSRQEGLVQEVSPRAHSPEARSLKRKAHTSELAAADAHPQLLLVEVKGGNAAGEATSGGQSPSKKRCILLAPLLCDSSVPACGTAVGTPAPNANAVTKTNTGAGEGADIGGKAVNSVAPEVVDDDDDDDDLDLDALEAQAGQAVTDTASLPPCATSEPCAALQTAVAGGGEEDEWDDGLDDLTAEQLAEIESRAL